MAEPLRFMDCETDSMTTRDIPFPEVIIDGELIKVDFENAFGTGRGFLSFSIAEARVLAKHLTDHADMIERQRANGMLEQGEGRA